MEEHELKFIVADTVKIKNYIQDEFTPDHFLWILAALLQRIISLLFLI
jgi:hypothetical protein